MDTQPRARRGGELGPNGEWYDGGKFIATKDSTVKSAPLRREPSAADVAAADVRRAKAERIALWLDGRRRSLADVIATLTAQPADSTLSPQGWARSVATFEPATRANLAERVERAAATYPFLTNLLTECLEAVEERNALRQVASPEQIDIVDAELWLAHERRGR